MKAAVEISLRLALAAALSSACTPHAESTAEARPAPSTVLRTGAPASDSFSASMHEAMARMDRGMAVACTGNPDRDFASMMIPHHQGAVDMALVELRFGHDERLRRLAQGIIVEQRQEIAVMAQVLGGGGGEPHP